MRVEEFANAQDQLDLWKKVSDAVWAGINAQRQQQAQLAAKTKAKPKGRALRGGVAKPKPIKVPTPKGAPRPKPQAQNPAQTAAIAKSKGQVATPVAAPIKPGTTAALAARTMALPRVAHPRPARPMTPLQRWLNRRPWGVPTPPNISQMPQTDAKSGPLPVK